MKGISINEVYSKACKLGLDLTKQEYDLAYEKAAKRVYHKAKLTPGIEDLIDKLFESKFKIAIVSASIKVG